MSPTSYYALNVAEMPWQERFNEKIGRPLFRKDLYTDTASGMTISVIWSKLGDREPSAHP